MTDNLPIKQTLDVKYIIELESKLHPILALKIIKKL